MPKPIITEYVFPPIPVIAYKWVAFREGNEESGLRGYGMTETAAIQDLKEQEAHERRL